jgi:hypothetical protein
LRVLLENAVVVHEARAQTWTRAFAGELADHPKRLVLVDRGEDADVVVVVEEVIIDVRSDDGVRVWHVKGQLRLREGYLGALTLSYEEPNTDAVLMQYAKCLPDRVRWIRERGAKGSGAKKEDQKGEESNPVSAPAG